MEEKECHLCGKTVRREDAEELLLSDGEKIPVCARCALNVLWAFLSAAPQGESAKSRERSLCDE